MGKTPAGQTRRKVLEFVKKRLLAGLPPTVREVQKALGFRAVQTAQQHLKALVDQGLLESPQGRARGYRLAGILGQFRPPGMVPLLGRVPAGPLSTAVEEFEEYIPVDKAPEDEELFALTVKGDSMVNAGILPGDLVIVRKQESARDREIVLARVGEEATLKRLRFRGKTPELHAENPDYQPIRPEPGELFILGRVVEIRRRLD